MKEKSSTCVGGDIKNLHFWGVKKRPSGRYAARIKTPGRSSMWLGTFDTAEEAALAYDEAARKYRGDMANTNFPLPEKIKSHGHCKNRVKIKDHGPEKVYIEKSKESGFGKEIKKVQYRGIRKRSSGNYAAEIWSSTITNKRVWLGTFGTAEEAALAYDAAAREHHRDKAITNFPLPGEITSPGHSNIVGPSPICDDKTMHMEEPNDPSLNFVAYGTDSRLMSIACCERENKSEFNLKAHEKAKKAQLLSENVEDDKSMVSKISKSVSDFENFEIVVNGSIINHELPYEIRKKYFDLCSNHKSVLHGGFLKGIGAKLGVEIISETTKISELIRDCELKTCEDNLQIWDKILAGFEMLGMDVFFIRARINRLLGLLWESKLVDSKVREINCWFREEANDSW